MINIGIIGGGKIGSVLYKMLSTDLRFKVTLADKEPHCDAVILDVTDKNSLNSFVLQQNAIINAMPYTFNKIVAETCAINGVSYFDFSEDVETTNYIKSIGYKHILLILDIYSKKEGENFGGFVLKG